MPSLSPLSWTYAARAFMPLGNRSALACNRPAASRVDACQQSSMLTYSYPASLSPRAAIASAVCLMSSSLIVQLNWFQLFHPIGGVSARLMGVAGSAVARDGDAAVAPATGPPRTVVAATAAETIAAV